MSILILLYLLSSSCMSETNGILRLNLDLRHFLASL